jgi:hypothetical protein
VRRRREGEAAHRRQAVRDPEAQAEAQPAAAHTLPDVLPAVQAGRRLVVLPNPRAAAMTTYVCPSVYDDVGNAIHS